MSNSAESESEVVAELLKKLSTILPEELEKATKRYNEMVTELNHYKTKYTPKPQGQDQMQVAGTRQSEALSKAIGKLKEENESLKRQVDELKNRQSSLNPDIADLSDPYRPTNIAEKFKQLYDDEWVQAFEVLDKMLSNDETKVIDFLANIVKEADKFCSKATQSQMKKIQQYMMDDLVSPKIDLQDGKGTVVASKRTEVDKHREETANMLLINFRKSVGILSVPPLVEIFESVFMKKLKEGWKISSTSKEIDNYVANSIELIWMMKIQHPPMEFEWKYSGEIFDKNRFVFYTKRGEKIKQTVWPAVLLHRDGPLVSKGVVQAI